MGPSHPRLAFPRCLRLGGNAEFGVGRPDLGGEARIWGGVDEAIPDLGGGVPHLAFPYLGGQLQKRLSYFR